MMIKAVIFDLDGTLIQTEILKARSYAKAISEISEKTILEEKVLAGFNKYVGLSRTEVVNGLVHEFQKEFGSLYPGKNADFIQQTILSRRLAIYKQMINDSELLSGFFCPFNIGLLRKLSADGYTTALATMSHLSEAKRMLDTMEIKDLLSVIVTKDNVIKGKPDPEIYLKINAFLGIKPEECLVVEDSVNGIKAGIKAGMSVFAVTNDITRESVHKAKILDKSFIIDELNELTPRIYQFLSTSH
ncbi:MAG: HAD family hydrolase [Bacteroidales bacterium]